MTIDARVTGERHLTRMLRENLLFADCSERELAVLEQAAFAREARRGCVIVTQEAPFPYLGFVLQGVVGVTAFADGEVRGGVRRLRLYEAYAGQTFCDISFLDGCQAMGEITVVSKKSSYVLFPAEVVRRLGDENPRFLQRLATHAASRCRDFVRRLVTQAAHSVTARVATVLLPFAGNTGGLSPVDPQLLEFTQRDIAAAAGCVKEAAARAIAQLESVGALRREHGRVRYIDRDKLLEFAEIADPGV